MPYMIKHFIYYSLKTSYLKNSQTFLIKQLVTNEERRSEQEIFQLLFDRLAAFFVAKKGPIIFFFICLKM